MAIDPATGAVARIDALLPQTQCTRCGYSGCEPYAVAIADGSASINQCPPGGSTTIQALATLLNLPILVLNPLHGVESAPKVAWIDESRCIGCARCLAPCPVDAIVGAAKFTHTVIAEQCTGCELCLAPCPVDCIELRPTELGPIDASINRKRYVTHVARLRGHAQAKQRILDAKKAGAPRDINLNLKS